jgi:hypothetical protein
LPCRYVSVVITRLHGFGLGNKGSVLSISWQQSFS